ncbi:hypothetical protein BCR35DRAFT_349326 [Leucosporidium creatinivorum]|uniref:Cupin type-2 domain-containing protein n=1 Tax=Leucosporidium creatinivorum TaxID=106004 RepID=A0A1Y2G4S8_9BASI|nr:hypothetical protein BCR35DRAFT_349326 [Leucosporidium creatinivorum]
MGLFYTQPKLQVPAREADGSWVFFGGAFKTFFISGDKHHFTSRQIFTPNNPYTGNGRASIATPPYHTHLYQTETFDVKSGTLAYCIDGKEGTLEAGQKVQIPPLRPHTFWNGSATENLDVHITVRGGDNPGFDETFVHNFYGYLSSQTMQGLAPNPFQMLLFMYSADVILMDIPLGLGSWANLIAGKLIGQNLLGMSAEYKEFSDESE